MELLVCAEVLSMALMRASHHSVTNMPRVVMRVLSVLAHQHSINSMGLTAGCTHRGFDELLF